MPSNFPAGSDNFTIPNSPGSTALSSAGTSSRNHVQSHRDIGDAIEAMQAEASLAVHSHDEVTARHGDKLDQANTHENADTDTGPSSIHHTLGVLVNQAAPGNHASLPAFAGTHAGSVTWPVGSIFMSVVAGNPSGDLGGTWVQITDVFLIGAGGSYTYTGSTVANATTHTHSIAATSSDGSHSHTPSGGTSTSSTHTHTQGSTGSTAPSHSHSSSSGTTLHTGGNSGGTYVGLDSHTHSIGTASGASHSHTGATTDAAAGHSHTTTTATSTHSAHSHDETASTVSHLPPWRAIYMWKRTA